MSPHQSPNCLCVTAEYRLSQTQAKKKKKIDLVIVDSVRDVDCGGNPKNQYKKSIGRKFLMFDRELIPDNIDTHGYAFWHSHRHTIPLG